MSAWFTGGSIVSSDDQGFWDVVLQARREASAGHGMTITLDSGRKLKVETQTGCAGAVTASAFDADPTSSGAWATAAPRSPPTP